MNVVAHTNSGFVWVDSLAGQIAFKLVLEAADMSTKLRCNLSSRKICLLIGLCLILLFAVMWIYR